ncbi:MAG TPA: branched-chain amino acid ABC transporter permease [Candidatus Dormibacteraeota bacterium]
MSRLRSLSLPALAPGAAALAGLLLPFFLYDAQLTLYIFVGLDIIVVAGLVLLQGFAGQVSLGQGAFYAIGAYFAGILSAHHVLPGLVALLLAPAFTALLAGVIGLPLLRLRGHYLAFATLAFQLILLALIGQAGALTGGDTGLPGIPDLSLGGMNLAGDHRTFAYALLVWALTVGALLLTRNLVASRPGRALRALATSEAAALASGVPVGRYKLQVFALAAAYAGLAGAVHAFFVSYIAPGSFPILLSIQFLVMASVAGVAVVVGPVVGAAGIYLLAQALQWLGSQPGMPAHAPAELNYSVYGLVLVAVMLFAPQGVPNLRARRPARPTRLSADQPEGAGGPHTSTRNSSPPVART